MIALPASLQSHSYTADDDLVYRTMSQDFEILEGFELPTATVTAAEFDTITLHNGLQTSRTSTASGVSSISAAVFTPQVTT